MVSTFFARRTARVFLTGALLVGDSVRGSLRDLVHQRLGPVEFALTAQNFIDESLAERVKQGVRDALLLRETFGEEG